MKVHPAAALFPMLDGDAYAALLNDIREHGQREPVRIWNGMLLDGRNRWRACEELGIDCVEDPFHGTEQDAIDLVLSLNLHRRHLDAGQRACVAVEVLPLYEAIAAKARAETQGRPKADEKPTQIVESVSRNERLAAAQAARATGANRQYVSDAKALKAAAPEDFEAVKRGEMTLPEAKRKNAKPKLPREEKPQSSAASSPAPQPPATIPEPPRLTSEPAQSNLLSTARAAIARWSREATDDEWRAIVKALDDADTARAENGATAS